MNTNFSRRQTGSPWCGKLFRLQPGAILYTKDDRFTSAGRCVTSGKYYTRDTSYCLGLDNFISDVWVGHPDLGPEKLVEILIDNKIFWAQESQIKKHDQQ